MTHGMGQNTVIYYNGNMTEIVVIMIIIVLTRIYNCIDNMYGLNRVGLCIRYYSSSYSLQIMGGFMAM